MMIKNGLILAIAAGGVAGVANGARDITPIELEHQGEVERHGYVYVNMNTGERVVSQEASQGAAIRGAAWTWDNSVVDPCLPADFTGTAIVSVFTGVHSETAGDAVDPFAIRYWGDWFEAPNDTIINGFTFEYWTQLPDAGEDGVAGSEFLMVFTEQDDLTNRSGAIAHSPIVLTDLFGAEDDGADGAATAGDGIIEFAEGNLWVVFLDFAGGGTDIEVADSNGVSDGAFGVDSIYSGVPGGDLDTDPAAAGFGLNDCGYVIGYRQPNVAEGDGLIARFPELAGIGLENPDGLDPNSFPNILPMGTALVHPSARAETYLPNVDPAAVGFLTEWPLDGTTIGTNPDSGAAEAVGSWDGMVLYDAIGQDVAGGGGAFYFGGFACDAAATTAPFYLAPYAGWSMSFNVNLVGGPVDPGCNPADIAEPFGVLDLADINAFIGGFLANDPISDLTGDGIWDLGDINAFIGSFLAGCP
jgi:hypothetical protein